ncbi:MAG: TolC family outer membrane protein [Rhodospirillales bacterium]|nr:TolC family outer membrane protein [Rhodospirillales bacterium]
MRIESFKLDIRRAGIAAGLFAGMVWSGTAATEPLSALLPDLLDKHHLTAAAEADLAAARERVREAMGGWYPQLNVTTFYGNEKQNKPSGTTDTNMVTRQLDITVTQLLWDFDLTSSTVRSARLVREQANTALEAARQNVLLRGIVAYLNVMRANEVLEFARRSEANIQRQTELENARVARGAGFSTDVLQAKTQLAGAQARRVQAEGALRVARNAYRAMFYMDAGKVGDMSKPILPVDMVPATIEEAVEVAFQRNPQLRVVQLAAEVARETITSTRATGYFPRIDAIGEAKFSVDEGGTVGSQNEQLAKVQLSWPFNLGLTARNSVRAARSDFTAAQQRYADARDLIEEETRNAWENLRTARENAELLMNQANIAAEFLELARKERQLGRRSLLDVLAAETTLVNSSSDAASAETDVSIALFSLLTAMGILDAQVTTKMEG